MRSTSDILVKLRAVAAVVLLESLSPHRNVHATPPVRPDAIAVVELFTSEGCSSCPPADRLLSELIRENEKSGYPVYALSFHVDYWNYLGWSDSYSRAEFSLRQQRYADALHSRTYTPQMIVNGRTEFVGSDADAARSAVRDALAGKAETAVTVDAEWVGSPADEVGAAADAKKAPSAKGGTQSNLRVTYGISGQADGDVVNLAVVEKDLSDAVGRGENRGRTLRHDNVVRAFAALRLDAGGKGSAVIPVPAGVARENASVIAYVQGRNLAVTGAARVPLAR